MSRNYNIYYMSRLISNVGDSLQEVAIIIIASYINSIEIVGIIIGFTALIKILCSIIVLVNPNKYNSKSLLIFLNILYGIITLFFYLYFILSNEVSFWIVIIYELFCSLIYTFYKIYQDVLIKEVCSDNKKIAGLFTMDNIVNILTILLGSTMILYINSNLFLLLNAISFFISAGLVKLLKIEFKDILPKVKVLKENQFISTFFLRIKKFKNKNKKVYIIILFMAIISFSYATFSMFLQYSLKKFEIKNVYIGYITGIYYLSTVVFSYIVGYIKSRNIIKYISLFIKFIILGFISLLIVKNKIFIVIIPLIYSIYGGGINTLCQVFFQNNLSKKEISIMKGIYNILCGISIILSSIINPYIISKIDINFFILTMILINIASIFLLRRSEKNDF